jgi:hypothetical protein
MLVPLTSGSLNRNIPAAENRSVLLMVLMLVPDTNASCFAFHVAALEM